MQRAACLAHQIKETCKFILDLGILLSIIIRICLFLFYLSNCVLSTVCLNVFPRVQFPYSFCESVSQVNFKVCLKTCLFTSGWFHKFSSCKSCKVGVEYQPVSVFFIRPLWSLCHVYKAPRAVTLM